MAKKKKADEVPILYIPKNASLKQIYAIAKKEFTAADLQKYTEIEEDWVPADQVLAEMEAIEAKASARKNRQ